MIVYYISPLRFSTPNLFSSFNFESTEDISKATVVFFDLHTRIGDYDESLLDYVIQNSIPTVTFNEYDYGSMAKDQWPNPLTKQQKSFLDDLEGSEIKTIHFVRKMDKTIPYPKNVFPYEKILEKEFPMTTKEELCSRPYEIGFLGNKSPSRVSVINALVPKFNMMVSLGENKIPHEDWLSKHRQCKLFLTADGGGFSDERMQQLITISPMLRQKNNHLQAHPFSDCINCVEVSEVPTEDELLRLRQILDNPDYLFEIYTDGVQFAVEFYSAEARSKYILNTLNKSQII